MTKAGLSRPVFFLAGLLPGLPDRVAHNPCAAGGLTRPRLAQSGRLSKPRERAVSLTSGCKFGYTDKNREWLFLVNLLLLFAGDIHAASLFEASRKLTMTFPSGGSIEAVNPVEFEFGDGGPIDTAGSVFRARLAVPGMDYLSAENKITRQVTVAAAGSPLLYPGRFTRRTGFAPTPRGHAMPTPIETGVRLADKEAKEVTA